MPDPAAAIGKVRQSLNATTAVKVLPSVFGRYRAEIDAELRSLISERASGPSDGGVSLLYDMMRYHLGWMDEEGNACAQPSGGKAVRPMLCLLACEACGGDYRRALPAAAAVELVHNYSLIHDDIQDDDRERRHRPTVWSVWGKPQAINAGSAMRMLANAAVRRLDVPAPVQTRVQSLIDDATTRLIEGQFLDISYESRFDITSRDYLTMVGGKTAALISCAFEVGALLGTDDEMTVSISRDVGWNLGLAFQARDDILGIWGRREETGKPLGGDIVRRKKTLPVVFGLEKANGNQRRRLIRAYNRASLDSDAVAVVMDILERVGAREESQRLTQFYASQAEEKLELLPPGAPARPAISEVIRFLVERTF